MPIILQFPRSQYPSLQVGDIGYYAVMNSTQVLDENEEPIPDLFTLDNIGGFNTNNPGEDFIEIGAVMLIDNTTSLSDGTLTTSITFHTLSSVEEPILTDFIFFSKNDRLADGITATVNVNKASPLGYYASTTFVNTDGSKAEMFSASCEISESSK